MFLFQARYLHLQGHNHLPIAVGFYRLGCNLKFLNFKTMINLLILKYFLNLDLFVQICFGWLNKKGIDGSNVVQMWFDL